MLLTHPFYATFTRKPIADAHASSQVLLCISCDSPAEVDRITDGGGRGGRQGRRLGRKTRTWAGRCTAATSRIPTAINGKPMWMDPDFAEQGAHPVDEATAA